MYSGGVRGGDHDGDRTRVREMDHYRGLKLGEYGRKDKSKATSNYGRRIE